VLQAENKNNQRERKQSMSNLRDTFLEELADLYDAEKQLIKALPKMAKAAKHEDLKRAFEMHLDETEEQVNRLERVFEVFDQTPKGKKCKGMKGLLEEGEERIREDEGDAALICAAQKVEHYEIAAYGSLLSWAKLLGEDDAADLLDETLEEEKATDEKLTETAEQSINVEENEEDSEDEKEEAHAGSKKRANK
jgi:ferritin-like metal-binding protein YciE